MKLRDRLRTGKGTFYNWPPIWTNRQDPTDKLQGEIGNLEDVSMSEDAANMGAMGFESPALCLRIATGWLGPSPAASYRSVWSPSRSNSIRLSKTTTFAFICCTKNAAHG